MLQERPVEEVVVTREEVETGARQDVPPSLQPRLTAAHCGVCDRSLASLAAAKSHYGSKLHRKRLHRWFQEAGGAAPMKVMATLSEDVESYSDVAVNFDKITSSFKVTSPTFGSWKNASRAGGGFPARIFQHDDLEGSMRELVERERENKTLGRYVENSAREFHLLLEKKEELESEEDWNLRALGQVNKQLRKLHDNLVGNLSKAKACRRHIDHSASLVAHIGRCLGKPEHGLVALAEQQLETLRKLKDRAEERLAGCEGVEEMMRQRQEEVWGRHNEAKAGWKKVRQQLVEVEAAEELRAELDDWRWEAGRWSDGMLEQQLEEVTLLQEEAASFGRDERVGASLGLLQGARVQALLTWVAEQPREARPGWLGEELATSLAAGCIAFLGQQRVAALLEAGGGGEDRWSAENYGLLLQGVLARGKYSHLELARWRREVEVHRRWLEQRGEPIEPAVLEVGQRATERVEEAAKARKEWMAALGGGREEGAATRLELARLEARHAMGEVLHQLERASCGAGGEGQLVLFE